MSQAVTEQSAKYRHLTRGWRLVSAVISAAAVTLALLFIFHWRPFGFVISDVAYLYYLVAAFLPLCFLWIPISGKASREHLPWYDIALAVLSVVAPTYFVTKEWELLMLGWAVGAPTVPYIFSLTLWVLMVEAARRAGGSVFAAIVFFFSIYPLFGSYMPWILETRSYALNYVASFHILSIESLMGLIMHVFGNLVLGFMVFAVVIQSLGAGKFFNDLALAVVGKTRGGTAKVAILSSGFFGSISGAVVPNVMTTGAFTIPAMKKEGLPAAFAGAVETCASTGGTLMPPVMGTVAFIMAEFLAIPYFKICIVAVVPAILYYVCLFAQVDSHAARIGLRPSPITVEVPSIWSTLFSNLHIILSFLLLILILFFLRLTSQAPWIATGVMIVLAMFRKETRLKPRHIVRLFEDMGRVLGDLIAILGPVGLILGSFILTGLAYSFPNEIISLSGGNVILMLLFGALAAFILGMGVTVSAVYIFLAIVLAPGLVQAGFDLLASHLFVVYCGMLSAITPPVALAAFAAASISGASPMKTGFQAMKLGGAIYILPFVFVLNPALILRAPVTEILLVIPTTLIGLIIVGGALEGYFWRLGNLTMMSRILLFSAGMLLVVPTLNTDLYGIALFVAVFFLAYRLRGRSPLSRILVRQTQSETDNKQT